MTVKLSVEGMTCDHCVRAVREALSKVSGVERVVDVDRERGQAVVDGNPDVGALIAAIEEEGYRAQAG